GRRHIDDGYGRARGLLGFSDVAVDGHAFEVLARTLRVDAGHEGGLAVGVLAAHASVELTGLAGDALRDDFGVFIDQNRHWANPMLSVTWRQPRPSWRPRPWCRR